MKCYAIHFNSSVVIIPQGIGEKTKGKRKVESGNYKHHRKSNVYMFCCNKIHLKLKCNLSHNYYSWCVRGWSDRHIATPSKTPGKSTLGKTCGAPGEQGCNQIWLTREKKYSIHTELSPLMSYWTRRRKCLQKGFEFTTYWNSMSPCAVMWVMSTNSNLSTITSTSIKTGRKTFTTVVLTLMSPCTEKLKSILTLNFSFIMK